VQVVPDVTGS